MLGDTLFNTVPVQHENEEGPAQLPFETEKVSCFLEEYDSQTREMHYSYEQILNSPILCYVFQIST